MSKTGQARVNHPLKACMHRRPIKGTQSITFVIFSSQLA